MSGRRTKPVQPGIQDLHNLPPELARSYTNVVH